MIKFEDVEDQLIEALQKKKDDGCPYLQGETWTIEGVFTFIPLNDFVDKTMYVQPLMTMIIGITIIGNDSGILRTFSINSLIPDFKLENVNDE